MRLLRFTVRTHRTSIVVWTVLLGALALVTGDAYENSYPSAEARHAAAELARENPATTAMYGQLAHPGTSAQYFTWEMGAFLTILAAVAGVLLAIASTRGPEDAGTLEVLRGSGISPQAPLRTSITMLSLVALLIAAATGVAIAVGTRGTEGAT